MRDGDAAWVADVAEQTRQYVEHHHRLDRDVRRLEESVHRLESAAQQAEEARLYTSLRWEAAREATVERRHLLACVAAALAFDDMTLDDKARVERVVRQLDPDEARFLYAMERSLLSPALLFDLWSAYGRRSVLTSLGCIDIDYKPLAGAGGGKPTLRVSDVGGLALRGMRLYLRERGPAFLDKYRDPAPSDDEERDVWRRMQEVEGAPGLLQGLSEVVRHPVYTPPPLPAPDALGTLFFGGAPAAHADQVASLTEVLESLQQNLGVATSVHELPDTSIKNVEFVGPHPVLRVLADYLEARWIAPR
ncbi:MAG: hypothetical protein IPM35_34645 [Myxococcales bacterium]|nr:hypothetical protein [Myxococcales bacterium]